ncbi:YebC/PmpR family DNA-binding transcriptional regulator [bacterium]|nr:YebC/PmpR family DNA-binding transcriptional regulator [bacterium]
MAGHSKWANIRFRKEIKDKRKGKLFSKLARDISIAVKLGGPDPDSNSRLRIALQAAKAANLPKGNIERAIKRGSGEGAGELEEFLLEGYGPGGAALLIKCVSDNKNRALSEVRHLLSQYGGKLAEAGSVKWMFKPKGRIVLSRDQDKKEEEVEMAIIESGAEDYEQGEGIIVVYTHPEKLEQTRLNLEKAGIEIETLALGYEPENSVEVSDKVKEKIIQLLEKLENLEEVSEVYANLG